MMIMNYLRYTLKLHLKPIGKFFGKDHTTVMHSTRSINNLFDVYPEIKDKYMSLKQYIEL